MSPRQQNYLSKHPSEKAVYDFLLKNGPHTASDMKASGLDVPNLAITHLKGANMIRSIEFRTNYGGNVWEAVE